MRVRDLIASCLTTFDRISLYSWTEDATRFGTFSNFEAISAAYLDRRVESWSFVYINDEKIFLSIWI